MSRSGGAVVLTLDCPAMVDGTLPADARSEQQLSTIFVQPCPNP